MQANQSFWAFYLCNYKICRTFAPGKGKSISKYPPPVFEIECNKFANVLDKNGLSYMLGKEVVRFRENFIFL